MARLVGKTALLVALGGAASVAFGGPPEGTDGVFGTVVQAAIAQTQQAVTYDGAYRRIPYPGGDVPPVARPDPSIDHRRVPNLQTYFRRKGAERRVSPAGDDYEAGDVVTWMLPGNLPHIGIVVDRRSPDGARPLVVHNIGRGPQLEDVLFAYPVTGHYRYPAGHRR